MGERETKHLPEQGCKHLASTAESVAVPVLAQPTLTLGWGLPIISAVLSQPFAAYVVAEM